MSRIPYEISGAWIEVSKECAEEHPEGQCLILSPDSSPTLYHPISQAPYSHGSSFNADASGVTAVYLVPAKANSTLINRLFDLTEQAKKIQDEIDLIKGKFTEDGELALSNTAYTSYTFETEKGTISMVNKQTVEVAFGAALRQLLQDEVGEIVSLKPPAYSIENNLTQVLNAIASDTLGLVSPAEYVDCLADDLLNPALKYQHTCKRFKKSAKANQNVFMNTFGMDVASAEKAALEFSKCQNFELFAKFAGLAGYSANTLGDIEMFKQKLQDLVIVKSSYGVTVKPKMAE